MELKFKNKEHRILWGLIVYSIILGALLTSMFFFIDATIKNIDIIIILSNWVFVIPLFVFVSILYLLIFTYNIVEENYLYLRNKLTLKSKK